MLAAVDCSAEQRVRRVHSCNTRFVTRSNARQNFFLQNSMIHLEVHSNDVQASLQAPAATSFELTESCPTVSVPEWRRRFPVCRVHGWTVTVDHYRPCAVKH